MTTGIVEEFVEALLDRDWPRLTATLSPDVHRDGFEGAETDSVTGRDEYMAWAERVIDPLAEYRWTVHRLEYTTSGTAAFLEATSHYRVHESDEPFGYRMAITFDVDDAGLVSRVSLYWKTPDKRLPVDTIAGAAAG